MKNPYCQNCDIDKYRKDGNCSRIPAEDGFIARCTSSWTNQKHNIIRAYSYMITIGMKNRFNDINYVDLFAGPGKYFDRTSGKEHDGSPLLAIEKNFSNIFLNDIKPENVSALQSRTKNFKNTIHLFNKDANKIAEKINSMISLNSLNFCFIDPNNMGELKFDTIINLTESRKFDLLINFPIGTDFKRASDRTKVKYDEFFNNDSWQEINQKLKTKNIRFLGDELVKLYIKELVKIGYQRPPTGEEYKNYFPVYNKKNVLMYYLIFVSKHPKGYDFCKKMRKYAKSQQEFDF